jgi:hypothetical protein
MTIIQYADLATKYSLAPLEEVNWIYMFQVFCICLTFVGLEAAKMIEGSAPTKEETEFLSTTMQQQFKGFTFTQESELSKNQAIGTQAACKKQRG